MNSLVVESFDGLTPLMERAADKVSAHYAALIAEPAARYRAARDASEG
ncbi:hypothetical protein [Pacificispira sp.]